MGGDFNPTSGEEGGGEGHMGAGSHGGRVTWGQGHMGAGWSRLNNQYNAVAT